MIRFVLIFVIVLLTFLTITSGCEKDDSSESLISGVIEGLKDKDSTVRMASNITLQTLGKEARAAVPALIEVLFNDDNEIVRDGSARALAAVGEPYEVIAPLIQALNDESMYVRISAARGLGEIGPQAKEALPKLRELARSDKEELVRNQAKIYIAKIEGK